MKSQALIIDQIRNWMPPSNCGLWEKKAFDDFDLIIVTTEPDYPGLEKVHGTVLFVPLAWDEIKPYDEGDVIVGQIIRKFAQVTGTRWVGAYNNGGVTHLDFKGSPTFNVTGFDWIDVKLIPLNEGL